MATVKLTGGKVTIKLGRVACSCCVDVCCLYSAEDFGDGLYLEADLPDEIRLNGNLLSRSGTQYGTTTNGVVYESGVWAVYVDSVRTTRNCLINGIDIEDEFLDQYTANVVPVFGSSYSETVTRQSLCVWSGPTVTIDYGDGPEWGYNVEGLGGGVKAPPQSSPVGVYDVPNTLFSFELVE